MSRFGSVFDSVLSDPYLYFMGPQGAIRIYRSNRMGISAVLRMPGMKQVNFYAYEKRAKEVQENLKHQKRLIRIKSIRKRQGILQLSGDHLLSLQFLQPVSYEHLVGGRFQQSGIQTCRSSTIGLKESDRGVKVRLGAAFEIVWAQGAGGRMLSWGGMAECQTARDERAGGSI